MSEAKTFSTRCRECMLMTRGDADAFSAELLDAFPRMKFVPENFWHKFWNFDGWRKAAQKAGERGLTMPWVSEFIRDPGRESPDYFASLGVEQERFFYAWVEPPNWRPRWEVHRHFVRLRNKPRLHFLFRRATFDRHGIESAERAFADPAFRATGLPDPPQPEDDDEAITLRGDRMLGGWSKGDDRAKAFVAKVWRIATRMTSNVVISYNEWTREPYPNGPDRESHVWAAAGAVQWALQRRHNYLEWAGHWFKPARIENAIPGRRPMRPNR